MLGQLVGPLLLLWIMAAAFMTMFIGPKKSARINQAFAVRLIQSMLAIVWKIITGTVKFVWRRVWPLVRDAARAIGRWVWAAWVRTGWPRTQQFFRWIGRGIAAKWRHLRTP